MGETNVKTSSFAAEAAGVLRAFLVIKECATLEDGGDKGQVHHWCDNEGMVKVMSKSTEANKAILRDHKLCRHIFAELLEARVLHGERLGGQGHPLGTGPREPLTRSRTSSVLHD